MPIDFPDNPGLTPNYQYSYNGITQNWAWDNGASAWIAEGFTITSGGQVVSSIYDLTDVTGQNFAGFGSGYTIFKYDIPRSVWSPAKMVMTDINDVKGIPTQTGQILTYSTDAGGAWIIESIPSFNYGQIAGGGVSMTKSPKFAIVAGDSSVTITGITSDAGITLTITAGAGGGANPEGPEGSIQFADSSSLSGIAEAKIVTVNNINNQRGFSGNFVYYTESTTANSNSITTDTTPITVPFGTRNIYVVDNIALQGGQTLTIQGFDASYTGASMTLILGHTGEATSSIKFPGSQGIYWSNGPFGVTTGTDSYIYTRPSPKKFDILYFFADGTRVYGNLMKDFKTSR